MVVSFSYFDTGSVSRKTVTSKPFTGFAAIVTLKLLPLAPPYLAVAVSAPAVPVAAEPWLGM